MINKIGVFDSGLGGLNILNHLVSTLPEYSYVYLADSARSPYGNLSFESVFHFTTQAVIWLWENGCQLVIVACNTASAKALRTIQKQILPLYSQKKVLGVIRPTSEIIGQFTQSNNIGILATEGTVLSGSYESEIKKFYPNINIFSQSCPLLVPIIEQNEFDSTGGLYFIKKYLDQLLQQQPLIDSILLGCTHYPLIKKQISTYLSATITLIDQGPIVAKSLNLYLKNHPEIAANLLLSPQIDFYTTDNPAKFNQLAGLFCPLKVNSIKIDLVNYF